MSEEHTPTQEFVLQVNDLYEKIADAERAESASEKDRTGFAREESIRTIDSQACLLLASVSDNLLALEPLVRARRYSFAPYAVARVAIEAAAKLSFLLDERVSVTQRVANSLSLRSSTINEQLKLAKALGDDRLVEASEARLEELAKLACELELPTARRKDQTVKWVGVATPRPTELVRAFLKAPAIYSVLSGVVHGDMNTLRQLGFEIAGGGTRGGLRVEPVVRHPQQEEMLRLVSWAYGASAWKVLVRHGAAAASIGAVLDRGFDQIGLGQESAIRFWRAPG